MPKYIDYPTASSLDGDELFLIVQDLLTKGVTVGDIRTWIADPLNTRINATSNTANIANATSIAAFGRANAANITAIAAFNQANNGTPDILARTWANNANIIAVGAFTLANSTNLTTGAAYNQANTAYDRGNLSLSTAQSSFTLANTVNTRSISAFNKANDGISIQGQGLDKFWYHVPYNYGNLSTANVQLSPSNGLTGNLVRNGSNNHILAPTGTANGVYNMIIYVEGKANTGTPVFTGFDNTDFGDSLPLNNQKAFIYVTVGPWVKIATIQAINY